MHLLWWLPIDLCHPSLSMITFHQFRFICNILYKSRWNRLFFFWFSTKQVPRSKLQTNCLMTVMWCSEQLYNFRQSPKWVLANRAQYVRSSSGLIAIVSISLCIYFHFKIPSLVVICCLSFVKIWVDEPRGMVYFVGYKDTPVETHLWVSLTKTIWNYFLLFAESD